MKHISISKFKELCLGLLDQISRSGEQITVTKRGKPIVVIYPAGTRSTRAKFGFARKQIGISGDLVSSLEKSDWGDLV